MIKKLMFLFALIVVSLSVPSVVSATDIVDGANSTVIQNEIDNAAIGQVITFTSGGTYNDISLKLNQSITIDGQGATLKGNGTTAIFTINRGSAPQNTYKDITIRNLTLIGTNAISGSGGTNITFCDLELIGTYNITPALDGTGIDVRGGGGCINLTIERVNANNFYQALGVGGGSGTVVNECNFYNCPYNAMSFFQNAKNIQVTNCNLTNSSYGIYWGGGVDYIIVSGNTITGMSCQGLGIIKSASNILISNNIIKNNEVGIIIKNGDTSHGGVTTVKNITLDNNTIVDNGLMGIFIQYVPERAIGDENALGREIIIKSNNNITNNGIRYKDEYYNETVAGDWNQEFVNTFNIVKTYYEDNTPPKTVEVEKLVAVEKTVEKIVTVEKAVDKDVVISHTVKASKTKIKKGKTITVSVKLKNFGKDKSNTIKVYNKYTKKTLTAILNSEASKTLKFTVKVTKKGINKIPIYLNGKLIATVKIKGL